MKVLPSPDYIRDLGIKGFAFLERKKLNVERTSGLRPEDEGPEDEEPGDQGQISNQSNI